MVCYTYISNKTYVDIGLDSVDTESTALGDSQFLAYVVIYIYCLMTDVVIAH